MTNFHYGENLRKVRQEKDISQEAMAIALGISQASYSRMETRSEIPASDVVYNTAVFLKVRPERLLAPLEEPDIKAILLSRGADAKRKAKEIFDAPVFTIVIYGSSASLIDVAYQCADGFFEGYFGMQTAIGATAKWIAAGLMTIYIWYWVRDFKRSSQPD